MRTSLLLAATLVAANSGAQAPLEIDSSFQFYYTPELMDYWTEHFAGGNSMWQPWVGDLKERNDGTIMATGYLLKQLDEMPWGYDASVIFQPESDGSVTQFLPSCGTPLIEIPSTNQYFSINRRRNYDCTGDLQYNAPDIYSQQRSLDGWHIFDDRSALSSGYFRITQDDPLRYVLIKVDEWGEWDSTWTPRSAFHPLGAFGRHLYKLRNGKFLFSGKWTHYEERPSSSIIRIDDEGVEDTTFSAPTLMSVMAAVYEQPDGKVILGGQFLMFDHPDTLKGSSKNRSLGFDVLTDKLDMVRS